MVFNVFGYKNENNYLTHNICARRIYDELSCFIEIRCTKDFIYIIQDISILIGYDYFKCTFNSYIDLESIKFYNILP